MHLKNTLLKKLNSTNNLFNLGMVWECPKWLWRTKNTTMTDSQFKLQKPLVFGANNGGWLLRTPRNVAPSHNAIFESLMDRLKIENSEVENLYKSNYPQEFKRSDPLIFVSGLVFGWYPWKQKGLPAVFSFVCGDLNYFVRGGESRPGRGRSPSKTLSVFTAAFSEIQPDSPFRHSHVQNSSNPPGQNWKLREDAFGFMDTTQKLVRRQKLDCRDV